MSVNINVAVLLETLAALSEGSDRHAAVTEVTKSVIKSLAIMPYAVVRKGANADMQSVTSFTDDGGALTPTTTILGDKLPEEDVIRSEVKTLTGKKFPLNVYNTVRWSAIASLIQDEEGIPPDRMRLISGGQVHWDGGIPGHDDCENLSFRESGVVSDTIVYLVLTLRGS